MIHATPKHPEILYVCKHLRAKSKAEMFMTRWDDDPDILANDYYAQNQFQWVAYHDGLPAAIIGANSLYPGVWGLYGFGTDAYEKILLTVTKHARRFMMPAVKNAGAHRAQCVSPADHVDTHKWLKMLGAKEEATLAGYGKNGEDAKIFAWTKE